MIKNFLLILTSAFLFSSIGFSEMTQNLSERDECLGGNKQKNEKYQKLYDAFNMLINDKNCFISKIEASPNDGIRDVSSAANREYCKIKIAFGETTTDVLLNFEIDKNKNVPFMKAAVKIIKEPKTIIEVLNKPQKNIQTKLNFFRARGGYKNANDYFYGDRNTGEKGFRELAVEKGACAPEEQKFLDEPNQNLVESRNSSGKHKN